MASSHCTGGDVFGKRSDCFNVCAGLIGVDNLNKTIFPDKVQYKALNFYPDEYAISSSGGLLLSPTNYYGEDSFVHNNFGVTVCYPVDNCFSSQKYHLVPKENIHFLDHSRQLWVKSIRQVASYGEFLMKDDHAVVCYPKLSATPLKLYNGMLCIISVLLLLLLLCHLLIRLKRPKVVSVFPATLFFGYIFQTLNYLWTCPKPLLFCLEKYFFITAFLWMSFQIFELCQNLHSIKPLQCTKYLPFVVSLLPLWFERLYSSNTVHYFRDSCDFLLTNGQYSNAILDTFIISVIIINSLVLRLVKSQFSHQKRAQDSALHEQFYLYVHLTIIGGVYISIKLVTDIIAIEEVNSNWFYLDMICQAFVGGVMIVYYYRLITPHNGRTASPYFVRTRDS